MFNNECNYGFLFNQLLKMLAIAFNGAKSDSDMLVKTARFAKKDDGITHDHQFFRKFRKQEISRDELSKYFDLKDIELNLISEQSIDLKDFGAWFCFKNGVRGFRYSEFGKESHLQQYWSFLEAHCDIEHELITKIDATEPDLILIDNYLKQWLRIENVNLSSWNLDDWARYLIHLTLFWCAMFELFYDIEFESDKYSVLDIVLPVAYSRNNTAKLSLTSEQWLKKFKESWGRQKFNSRSLSWEKLFQHIAGKHKTDPSLSDRPIDSHSLELINLDTSSIKKRFQRWRKGKLFSTEDMRKYFFILNVPYSDSELDVGLTHFALVNMFTKTQSELLNAGVAPTLIEKEFLKYSEYRSLIKSRYTHFCQTNGVLEP